MKRSEIPKFGPLEGLRVMTIGQAVAGPFAGTLMSDFGAQVIHVESTFMKDAGRMGRGGTNQEDHRNQLNMSFNIPTPEGREILFKLLKDTDIMVENSKGGQWEKWMLTDEVLWEVNPKLVIVHVSGFGLTGDPDYIARPAWDVIGQAFGTLASLNGYEDMPMSANNGVCDHLTGLFALWSSLAAYLRVLKTGKGESIDVAQYEACLRGATGGYPYEYFEYNNIPKRTGYAHPTVSGFRPFKCKDGFVFIAFSGASALKNGLPILGLEFGSEMFPTNKSLIMHGTESGRVLEEKLEEYCAGKTCSEAETELNNAGVPISPILDYRTSENHPHYLARNSYIEWENSKGKTIKGVGIVPKMKNAPGKVWRGAPEYGADNDDILGELGYSSEQIQALYENKIIVKD